MDGPPTSSRISPRSRSSAWARSRRPPLGTSIGGGSFFLLCTAIVAWPMGAWTARRRRQAVRAAAGQAFAASPGVAATRPTPRAARVTLWLAAVLLVAFVIALAAALANPMEIAFGVPRVLRVVLALPIAAAVLTAVSLVLAVRAWRRPFWRWWGRVYYAAVALAAAAFVALLRSWNLLGWHLR